MSRPIGRPRVTHWQDPIWHLRIMHCSLVLNACRLKTGCSLFLENRKLPHAQLNVAIWI